jgi:serine/threonine-protein phosphatase 5
VDLSTIQVEASYTGPRLPEPITLDFVKELMETFRQGGRLHRKYAIQIILGVIKLLAQLPTLVDIDVPPGTRLTVCGDVHGQFYDMLNIFKINGLPGPENPYLFNGDFVDRGSWSVEVILTFFSFKLLYPNHFHLTRGNHESRTLNQIYGFQGEVTAKLDQFCFELFNEAFCLLPLAYCIGKKVLVVHGGLFSEDGVTLDQIRAIDRNCQPPDKGLMCELLWSDPQEEPGRAPSKRGVGYSFGPDVTKRFLDDNKLDLLVRSHEVKAEGYEFAAGSRLVTVFSAPNYCDQMGNKGAFLVFDSTLKPKVTSFAAVEHPPVRPMQYANPLFAMQ